MQPLLLNLHDVTSDQNLDRVVLAQEIRWNDVRLHKGESLTPPDIERLRDYPTDIHAIRLDIDDVHEDEAALRIARAVAGPRVLPRVPKQSRVNLVAEGKGLLRIDRNRIDGINGLPDLGLFTLIDRLAVLPGKILAGSKITPVATKRSIVEEAERIAAGSPVIQVKPFRPLKVGVVTTEEMNDKVRERFQSAVRCKVAWYGGQILGFSEMPNDPAAVSQALNRYLQAGADLLMTGGGNTIDPYDAALRSVDLLGGQMVRVGAPAHPGSMFWLAYAGETPIFNLASCSMYSRSTTADLILPWIMAGERVNPDDLSGLGYGGLLDRDMHFRFPPYEQAGLYENPEE